jgi:hypothetical protein
MPLQTTGAISLANIQTEFGGANPIGLNEYYRNAGRVDRTVTDIPVTGNAISMNLFYGEANAVGLSVVASRVSRVTGGTITMPTGIQQGDIIIVGYKADWASNSGYPGNGFTRISSDGNDNGSYSDVGTMLSYKVAGGAENGSNVGGFTPNGSYNCVYVVRPSRDLRSIAGVDTGGYAGRDNAPPRTITTASAPANATTVALAVFGHWSSETGTGTFSPVTSSIRSSSGSGSDGENATLFIHIQNPALVTPVNVATDYNNNAVNAYSTGYIRVT